LTFRPSTSESGIVYGKTIVVRHCSRKQLSSGSVGGHCLLRNCFGFVCFLGGFGFWPSCGNSVLNQSLVGQLPSWFWLAPSCGSRGPARSFGLLIQSLVGPFPSWFWLGAEPQGQGVNKFLSVSSLRGCGLVPCCGNRVLTNSCWSDPLCGFGGVPISGNNVKSKGLLISSLRGDGFVPNCGNSVLTESGLLVLFVVLAGAELPEGFLHQP
jgi:hypothetical protein